MLTRARRGLIVFGHEGTLQKAPCWKKWLDYVNKKNLKQQLEVLISQRPQIRDMKNSNKQQQTRGGSQKRGGNQGRGSAGTRVYRPKW